MIKKEANTIVKHKYQITKYQITEIHRMWHVQAKVIPVKTAATGTISKSLGPYQSKIAGKQEIKEMHKRKAVFGTAHKHRQVLL